MHERQHLVDSEEKPDSSDPNRLLCEGDNSSLTQRPTQSQSSLFADSNLHCVLFNDLVQIVPLVQSLIDRKARSSYTRRGSIIYTKTPSREWLSKSITDLKGKRVGQSLPSNTDGFLSLRDSTSEKDREEFVLMKEKVEELQKKLLEKDKILESAENSRNKMKALNEKLDELKIQASEKDSLLKSTQRQLLDVKIKLADKQAALEKIQWQTMTSDKKVKKLQEEIDSMQGDVSSITMLLEGLTKAADTAEYTNDYDIKPYDFTHLPAIDDLDETEMQKIEEATKTYKDAVAAAKEKRNEQSIATAANARLHLQSILFKTLNFQFIIFLVLFQVFTRWAL